MPPVPTALIPNHPAHIDRSLAVNSTTSCPCRKRRWRCQKTTSPAKTRSPEKNTSLDPFAASRLAAPSTTVAPPAPPLASSSSGACPWKLAWNTVTAPAAADGSSRGTLLQLQRQPKAAPVEHYCSSGGRGWQLPGTVLQLRRQTKAAPTDHCCSSGGRGWQLSRNTVAAPAPADGRSRGTLLQLRRLPMAAPVEHYCSSGARRWQLPWNTAAAPAPFEAPPPVAAAPPPVAAPPVPFAAPPPWAAAPPAGTHEAGSNLALAELAAVAVEGERLKNKSYAEEGMAPFVRPEVEHDGVLAWWKD